MHHTSRSVVLSAAVLGLLVLSGCEDPEARKQASELKATINELTLKLEAANAKNQDLVKRIEEIQREGISQIRAGSDKMREDMLAQSKVVLDKIIDDSKLTRDNATTLVQGARSDADKNIDRVKADLSDDIKKLREELAATRDNLEKLMNNQLKDVYPYAFQPKRLEPGSAPDPQSK